MIGAVMFFSDITKTTRTAQIGDCVSGSTPEHIVGNRYKSVFLDEHLSVFHDNRKAIHIRIHHEAHIRTCLTHHSRYAVKILGDRLRCMREFACRLTIELYHVLYSERAKQLRDDCPSDGIDAVDHNREVCLRYGFDIDKRKILHHIDMA